MNKPLPIVALVGQPNVGKSSLLNRIAGGRPAVTSDVAGTTRDRQYIDTAWNGVDFTLVDTAGLTLNSRDELEHNVNKQIDVALEEADVVILVVDGKLNRNSVEQVTLQKFRKIKKPVILAVNKLESPKTREEKLAEFQSLGIKPMFGVSATSGVGLGDMLDEIANTVRWAPSRQNKTDGDGAHLSAINVSLVGKPNVGKSSIFNAILKEERVVVSPIPGTTRTAIDSQIKIGDIDYTFIDTAGLKKKDYRQEQPDVFSGFQSFKSIRRSDVCFLVIDATEEITKQDQRVAQEIFALEKGCIILATKIDKSNLSAGLGRPEKQRKGESDDKYRSLQDYISMHFPFLWMCPVFFVSGKTGEGIDEAIKAIKPIYDSRHKTVSPEVLKTFLNKKMKINPPKLLRDQKKPKVTGLTQVATNPPAFQLAVNHPAAISSQFRKFIENGIIRDLDFWGTPIILRLKGKDKA